MLRVWAFLGSLGRIIQVSSTIFFSAIILSKVVTSRDNSRITWNLYPGSTYKNSRRSFMFLQHFTDLQGLSSTHIDNPMFRCYTETSQTTAVRTKRKSGILEFRSKLTERCKVLGVKEDFSILLPWLSGAKLHSSWEENTWAMFQNLITLKISLF